MAGREPESRHIRAGHLRDLHGILVAGLVDGEADGGTAVEPRDQLFVNVILADIGDVADAQGLALRAGLDDDLPNRLCLLGDTYSADAYVADSGAHGAAGNIHHP